MKNLIVIGLLVVGVGALAVFGFNLGAEPVKGEVKSLTNEYGVTITVDDTPVIDAPGIEGQEYITQSDGTITIILK